MVYSLDTGILNVDRLLLPIILIIISVLGLPSIVHIYPERNPNQP